MPDPVTITEARVLAIIETYGGDPRRWPENERAAALAFIETSPTAQAAWADARALDTLLDLAPTPQPSDLAARRILAKAPRAPARFEARTFAALAAALVLGVVLGFQGMRVVSDGAEAEAMLGAAFEGPAILENAGVGGEG